LDYSLTPFVRQWKKPRKIHDEREIEKKMRRGVIERGERQMEIERWRYMEIQ